jgi:glycosyltransferase involved in cell wall biosynthesis
MRVLFIAPHPIEGPSSRFRVYQFLQYLREHGVDATVRPFVSSRLVSAVYDSGRIGLKAWITAWGAARRAIDTIAAMHYEVVYVLREAFPFGPPFFERALQFAAGRLVYDFDDAIYMPSLAYPNPLDHLRDFGKPAKVIRTAARVIAGNDHLREYALRFSDTPERVSVIPTVVNTDEYRPPAHRRDGRTCVVGWIGTPRGSLYLRPLSGVMAELVRTCPHVSFKFVGAEPFDVRPLPVTFKTWRLEDEVADLQSFDIGIMPLTDDEETRGKCGFKLIQYMSVGIPVVCSPVGANLAIVEEGANGLFAATPAQWFTALERLSGDPEWRTQLGERGRELAEKRFSVAAVAPRLLAVLREATA